MTQLQPSFDPIRPPASSEGKVGARLAAALPPVEPDVRLRTWVLARYDAAEAEGTLGRDLAPVEAPRGWRSLGLGVAAAAVLLIAVGTFWVSSSAGHIAPPGYQRAVVVVDDPSLLDPQTPGGPDDLARLDPITPSERWTAPSADAPTGKR